LDLPRNPAGEHDGLEVTPREEPVEVRIPQAA